MQVCIKVFSILYDLMSVITVVKQLLYNKYYSFSKKKKKKKIHLILEKEDQQALIKVKYLHWNQLFFLKYALTSLSIEII